MYSKLPNLVIGFHGCDKRVHDAILYNHKALKPSTNDYDWLGHGIYFWEQNYDRALHWAKEQAQRGVIKDPSVVGAVIDLGYCLNLTDSFYIELVENEYKLMVAELTAAGKDIPVNKGNNEDKVLRKLDCAVIQHLHERLLEESSDNESLVFDSARGLFAESEPIYPNAGFKRKTHVQICVRNPNCIKGLFHPMKPDKKWPIP